MLRKLLNLALLPFAFALVWFSRRSKRLIRFGEFNSQRLGHLIGNSESYLCEKDAGMQPDALDIWFPAPGRRANRLIEGKYRKLLRVWPRSLARAVMTVNAIFPDPIKHVVLSSQFDRDIHGLWQRHAPHIGFTAAEKRRGEAMLRHMGIPPGAKWVCVVVRDDAYLRRRFPDRDYSYHDYRDADLSEYLPAIVELMRRGYYVVRMGDTVAKHLNVKHARAIDYAVNGRSDFGDLYLGAHCAFCLGTPCGFTAIPMAFNRPLAVTDMAPLGYAPTWCEGLMIWKHHVRDGKRMTIREIFESDLGIATFSHLFKAAAVTLENNS